MPTSDFVRACSLAELKAKGRLVLHGRHSPILVVYDRGRIGMALMEHFRGGRPQRAGAERQPRRIRRAGPRRRPTAHGRDPRGEHDRHVNPLGVKGVGEIALLGVVPAIANAIFHATGSIRELPVTPDKLL